MSKAIAEQSNALSIFWLKKQGYFHKDYSQRSGRITWTYGYSENKNSIGLIVKKDHWGTSNEKTCIQLNYTHTNTWTGEKSDMDSKILLATTPCNYGGVRYWFICPLSKNGQYCGRRVGVIYSIGKWFGCRYCGAIAYDAQMKSRKFRSSSISEMDIERAEKEIRRHYYNGKPTRKYKRLMMMKGKFDRDLIELAARLDKQFRQRFAPNKK